MDDQRLNPEVKEVLIGVRSLRPVKLYPLSFRDQTKASDLISEAMQKVLAAQNQPDVVFVKEILDLIAKNADRILTLVMDATEKGEDVLSEITNQQLLMIAELIWGVNYAHLQKKLQSLFGTLEKVGESLPERPLRQFSDDITSIESKTSTGEAGKKAE